MQPTKCYRLGTDHIARQAIELDEVRLSPVQIEVRLAVIDLIEIDTVVPTRGHDNIKLPASGLSLGRKPGILCYEPKEPVTLPWI
jgi:hypothetical protein